MNNKAQEAIQESLDLANKAHHFQFRKLGMPYIQHPLEVMKLLWIWDIADYRVLCAALLHDAVEDKGATLEEVTKTAGSLVAEWVLELTFDKRFSDKNEYLATFSNSSVEALVIKLSDRFCNVSDYLLSRLDKAVKYYHKADNLYLAINQRKKEIIERFGEPSWAKIHNSFKSLEAKIESLKEKEASNENVY